MSARSIGTRRSSADRTGLASSQAPSVAPATGTLYWLLQTVGWLVFGAVMYAWAFAYWTPLIALVNKAVLVALGLLITLCFRPLFARVRRWGVHPAWIGPSVLTVSFAAAPLWYELHTMIFRTIFPLLTPPGDPQIHFLPGLVVPTQTWLFYGFVLTTWSLLYFLVHALLDLRSTRERAARAEMLVATARLRALQSQLEPHFLFNSLNALSTLVVRGESQRATEMISLLGDFLRVTLDVSDRPEIPLSTELQFVRDYLSIESIRFGERLSYVVDADGNLHSSLVPTLVLQPLVENAVRHGVIHRSVGGRVAITARRFDGTLRLTVEDDGPGWPSGTPTYGVGLMNTQRRLDELYGGAGGLAIERSSMGGARIVVNIPMRTERVPRAR